MATVYWSPWYPDISYASLHLLYEEPLPLLPELRKLKNNDNRDDNWLQCHAMLNHIKNTFILSFPFDISFTFHKEYGVVPLNQNSPMQFLGVKEPSLNNAHTFAILNNWIFWSDTFLEITSTPAYFHKPVFNGYYVPGSFNINSWFRPLEAAIQLHEKEEVVHIKKGDPLAYVKFNTNAPVTLKRFNFTQELSSLSNACIQYKYYEKSKGLNFLYSRFKKSNMDKAISTAIRNNLME